MFNVGDKVVYPMHGAGIIEEIKEEEILGMRQQYYVMRLPFGEMKVLIPLQNVRKLGLRGVIPANEVEKVLAILRAKKSKMSTNWNHRYRANLQKIRSGDIYEVAEVVRNLGLRDRDKGLSTGERRMLENARQILVSELVLAKGIAEDEAFQMIDRIGG